MSGRTAFPAIGVKALMNADRLCVSRVSHRKQRYHAWSRCSGYAAQHRPTISCTCRRQLDLMLRPLSSYKFSDGHKIIQKDLSLKDYTRSGPQLRDFIKGVIRTKEDEVLDAEDVQNQNDGKLENKSSVPYLKLNPQVLQGSQRKVFFQTYGCQMNVNDTEIAWSILQKNGFSKTSDITEADVILIMTCAVREGAENKVWSRLEFFKSLKKKRQALKETPITIGILGCMAERLKNKILEKEQLVDVVCGPDAYRDLPHLLSSSLLSGRAAVNVQLSLEETYADIVPVRYDASSPSAFVSIMRGCDNMCTYCIVPFTRGKERSRPISSIVEEVKKLSDEGIKEVTLLGQNVNSYRDLSAASSFFASSEDPTHNMNRGFRTVYKTRAGGLRFSDLLEKVSSVNPEMRIRFTSPHPKDFPDEVLQLIQERPNICQQIHLPAQSGSDAVLEAMGRGYTRAAYSDLVHHIRSIIPDVALSSDFIAGFCGESEQDHQATVSLIKEVQYNFAFCFPYSMRQKTRAYHRLKDDVPANVKECRHMELVAAFRTEAEKIHASQIGTRQLVLVEGASKRSVRDLAGRNEANTRVIFPKAEVPTSRHSMDPRPIQRGDYIAVQIISGTSQILRAVPLYHTSLQDFWEHRAQRQNHNNSVANSFS